VSSGPEERPVPEVAGRSVAEASNLLGQNGFVVEQTTEASSSVPEGDVIRTEPGAGTPQPKGAVVTLVVSSGPPEATVPSVIGLSEANAINTLQEDGFRVETSETNECGASDDGRVVVQDPSGNSTAEQGSTVGIVVCRFVPPADGGTDGAVTTDGV
jgi:serine/threonine-protein kinase